MPTIRRGTKSLMADHAAHQPGWRVVRSFHDSPPSPELREYAQVALFLAHLHLHHHSAKLVEGFIVSSHGPLGVLELPTQPHQPRLDNAVLHRSTNFRSIPTTQAATSGSVLSVSSIVTVSLRTCVVFCCGSTRQPEVTLKWRNESEQEEQTKLLLSCPEKQINHYLLM